MNISTHQSTRILFYPLIKICEYLGIHHPVALVKLRYFAKFKRLPNLKEPRDLNEKILWLKLFSDTSRWTELADKYKVRDYINKLSLGEYLVPLYGAWYNVEDINFDSLPDEVIFKANNGDGKGTNLIARKYHTPQKLSELKVVLSEWLSRKRIGALSAEPQYAGMPPMIIAEQVLKSPKRGGGDVSLTDYKVWCINGEPLYVWVCNNRDSDGGGADVMTYDLDWKAHPEFSVFTSEYRKGELIPKPKNFDTMLNLARQLSQGFPQLRVDLYNIDGKVYFGELTFTSQGGMNDFFSADFLRMMGDKIDLSNVKLK